MINKELSKFIAERLNLGEDAVMLSQLTVPANCLEVALIFHINKGDIREMLNSFELNVINTLKESSITSELWEDISKMKAVINQLREENKDLMKYKTYYELEKELRHGND